MKYCKFNLFACGQNSTVSKWKTNENKMSSEDVFWTVQKASPEHSFVHKKVYKSILLQYTL